MIEQIIIYIVANIVTVLTMEDFFSTFLEKRQTWKYIVAWVCFGLCHLTIMQMVHSNIGNASMNFLLLSMVCLLGYNASRKISILMISLAISLGGISEVIIMLLLIILKVNINVEENRRLYALLAKIIFWICVRIMEILYGKKVEEVRKSGNYINMLIIAACANFIWVWFIMRIAQQSDSSIIRTWCIILAFVVLSLDIIIFKLYGMYQNKMEVEREKREYAYQVQYYDKQIKDRQAMIQEVRRTRHDMKNNMIYLKELLNTDAEKAREFLDEYIGQSEVTDEISKSGNLAVDALINYKNMTAREKGVTMHLESQIPVEMPYESTDLSIILGNLLDNAIKATEKLEIEKDIFVSLLYQKEKLLIKIRNPYTGDLKKDRAGNYISEKKDRENHGIGLKSVRKVVEKYEGVMEIHTEDQTFEVYVIL